MKIEITINGLDELINELKRFNDAREPKAKSRDILIEVPINHQKNITEAKRGRQKDFSRIHDIAESINEHTGKDKKELRKWMYETYATQVKKIGKYNYLPAATAKSIRKLFY